LRWDRTPSNEPAVEPFPPPASRPIREEPAKAGPSDFTRVVGGHSAAPPVAPTPMQAAPAPAEPAPAAPAAEPRTAPAKPPLLPVILALCGLLLLAVFVVVYFAFR
jgi:hypothetical protein